MADYAVPTNVDPSSVSPTDGELLERKRLVNRMALRIRQSLELPDILQTCVTELRACLQGDRLLIYQFQPDWSGMIIAEAVADGIASALGNRISDSCFQRWQDLTMRGEVPVVANDIYAMGYASCHVQLLERYGVTANLVQPIYVNSQLWGLLIAHHCGGVRQWQPEEVRIVEDLSIQLAIAIQQSHLIAALKAEAEEHQRLEQAARESQQKLTTMLDRMVAVVVLMRFYLDQRFEYEYISRHCQELTGFAAVDFFTNTLLWRSRVHPEDWETIIEPFFQELLRHQPQEPQIKTVTYRFRRSDETWCWIQGKWHLQWQETGGYWAATIINVQVTDLKNTEVLLRQTQEQYEKAQQMANIGHWELNLRTNDLHWSPQVFRIFEIDPAVFDATYEGFVKTVHPEDRESVCQVYEDHLKTQQPYCFTHRLLMADGRVKYVREECETTFMADGTPLVSMGTVQDVTAEIALKQEASQKAQLQDELRVVETVLDDVIGGYWDWDMVADQEYLSPGLRRMLGYEANAQATDITSFRDVIFPEDFAIIQQSLERHIQSRGQTRHCNEVRYRHKDGSTVWVLCAGQIIDWDEAGRPLRMVGGHIDITKQKQDELALQESQVFIQAIADASPDVLYVFDIQQQRNIYVNQQCQKVLGYSPTEIQEIGDRLLREIIHPDDVDNALKHFEHLKRARPGMIVENEYRMRAKDGSWRWLLSRDAVFKHNEAGEVEQVVGVAQDITQRKLSEIQLKRQAQQERIIADIIGQIRASLNLNEVLTTTVQSLRGILESDRVLVYRIFDDGTGAAIAEAVSPPWPKLLDRVFPEEVFPHPNYQRYVNGRVFALYDRLAQQKNVLPCLLKFLREIGVRAKLVVPIVQQDKLWGLLIAHQCDGPRNWQDWETQLLRRVANQLAIAIQQADLYAQLQRELTERELAQDLLSERNEELASKNEQLARATRLKDEFLANMSHELRTPLNAILGLTEGVLDEIFGPITEKQRKSLETVERSGRHLLSLINDILDVAKIEAGEVTLDCMSLSVKRLCETSLMFIRQQAQQKNIQINCHIPDNLPQIWGDERRLHQVLINLLNNAVKFTPTCGQISLTARYVESPIPQPPHRVTPSLAGIERVPVFQPIPDPEQPLPTARLEIAIADSGIGIASENLRKLFKPFMQIDSALNRKYEGTGLGLALVKQLVELHGGEVDVFSRLNMGSTFTIRLPVMAMLQSSFPPDAETPPLSVPSPLQNPSGYLILLAEDNEANASTFSSYLEAKGYRVVQALNGVEAIALVQREKPNLILMDIQMPVMDGVTAIEKIRNELGLRDLPIIALTALAMDGDEERCLTAGANCYLSKPIKLKQLVTLLDGYLAPSQS